MKGNFSDKQALALISDCKVSKDQVKAFGKMVSEQFGEIGKAQKITAVRVVLLGHGFNVMKNSLERGQFRPWTESNVTQGHIWSKATAAKNVALYMRVWHAFLKQYKPSQTELLAITSGSSLDPDPSKAKGEGAKLIAAIADWVGERSSTEVIADEVLSLTAGSKSSGDDDATVLTPDTFLADISEWLLNLRKTTTDPEQLKKIPKRDIKALVKQVADYSHDLDKAVAALTEK